MAEEVPLLRRVLGRAVPFLAAAGIAAAAAAAVSARSRSLRRQENRRIVAEAARRVEVEPELLLAVASIESGFDEGALSPKGAVGLLQIMPATAAAVAGRIGYRAYDLRDARENAVIGAAYLKELLARYRGDMHLALAAYHAGPSRVDRWLEAGGGLPGAEIVEQFGYRETRRYVDDVLAGRARERR